MNTIHRNLCSVMWQAIVLPLAALSLLVACNETPQTFSFRGSGLDLPDGTVVAISSHEAGYEAIAETVIKDGAFELQADIQTPMPALLTTNNLALVEQNGWPTDSIRWNYIDCYISPCAMELQPDLTVCGGQPQTDFAEYLSQYKSSPRGDWQFMLDHPRSVVSVWLACATLQRGYHLDAAQLDTLEQTLTSMPEDTAHFNEFQQRLALYRKTVKGGALLDLQVQDTEGKTCQLTEVLPQGKYVFIDFWASWCGICLYSMPDVKAVAEEYAEQLAVIGVSCDTDETAWREAMAKHEMPWPHYILTKEGYDTFFKDYQVGNGVPYYLLIGPDGNVVSAPDHVDDVKPIIILSL